MKRLIAWLLFTGMLMQTVWVCAEETTMHIGGKAYDLEVRSMYLYTTVNGRHSALKVEQTTGLKESVNSITLEYDYEAQSKECVGKFEEEAPLALVTVDGFDERLAHLEPEDIVLTVNGRPVEVDKEADAYGAVGWEDALHHGGMSAVFPLVLTEQGGVYDFTVRVQGVSGNVRITETAQIQVKLVNTHEYKEAKTAAITDLCSEQAEVYMVGDSIYVDHPAGNADAVKVKMQFADENGDSFACITWAYDTVCKEENKHAVLYLEKDVKLDEDSAVEYLLDSNCAQERRKEVQFVLETKEALYRTKKYAIVERFDVEKEDPKGIHFAQTEKVLCVGDVYQPTVLGVKTGEVLRSGVFGKLTIAEGENTDAQVIDASDGKTVIAVKPGQAYITACYESAGKVYEAASMKIVVTDEALRECTVLCRNLNVRAGAGLEAEKVGMLHRGDVVQVVRAENGWALMSDGRYVSEKYIG